MRLPVIVRQPLTATRGGFSFLPWASQHPAKVRAAEIPHPTTYNEPGRSCEIFVARLRPDHDRAKKRPRNGNDFLYVGDGGLERGPSKNPRAWPNGSSSPRGSATDRPVFAFSPLQVYVRRRTAGTSYTEMFGEALRGSQSTGRPRVGRRPTTGIGCRSEGSGVVYQNVRWSVARTAVDRRTTRLTDGDRYARRNVVVRSAH